MRIRRLIQRRVSERILHTISITRTIVVRVKVHPKGSKLIVRCAFVRHVDVKKRHNHRLRRLCLQSNETQPQSRINVDFPNKLSTKSTVNSAVVLWLSRAGLSSTMSSEAMRPVSAIISITNCASR